VIFQALAYSWIKLLSAMLKAVIRIKGIPMKLYAKVIETDEHLAVLLHVQLYRETRASSTKTNSLMR
jgi:hypothetical protein